MCTIFELFDVEACRELEKGPLKVSGNGIIRRSRKSSSY